MFFNYQHAKKYARLKLRCRRVGWKNSEVLKIDDGEIVYNYGRHMFVRKLNLNDMLSIDWVLL